jgi:hypothetical protein
VNRYLRRLQRFSKDFAERRSQGEMSNTSHRLVDANTTQDVSSERAKGTRHRKMTADKWNQ